ncbi:MAG: RidA family protein [Xanthobacteraceae bacterium]|nr:RidA family protein [Xanthobacteraceae bacterium]
MPKQIVTSSSAPTSGFTPGQAVSPLAQAIRFGNMLFVSGLGSVDPGTGDVVEGDIASQTRRTLSNLMNVLEAAGATAKNIVNMHVILRNVADFPGFNETFREYFGGEKVTRTCIGGTPNRPGVNVQIDCIAMFD